MRRTLNIPIELILSVCKDKRQLELLSFRVYMMLVYKNATIFHLSPTKVSILMRCPMSTAERLIDDAKRSPWFSYCERRNSLRALSMKSKVVRLSNNDMYYRSDFCFLMRKRYISLSEMVKRLRGVIVMMIVMQANGKQFPKGATQENLPFIMVYQMTIAKKLGISQGAVSKLVAHLSSIGWIDKTKQAFYLAVRNGDVDKADEYSRTHHNCVMMQRSSSRYYCRTKSISYNYFGAYGLGYAVPDSFVGAFRHIIWTHKKRLNAA